MAEDPEIARYQAALKRSRRSTFKLTPGAIAFLVGLSAAGVGVALSQWQEHARNKREAQESELIAKKEAEESAKYAEAAKEEERRLEPLRSLATMYAVVDPDTLEGGPIELARGRRVLIIDTFWLVEDAEVRRALGMPETGEKKSSIHLPGGLKANEATPWLALRPEDVGTVVLTSSVSTPVGVYEGGKERGYETRYTFVAFTVPERKVVARWTHVTLAPYSIQRVNGVLLGSGFQPLAGEVYRADMEALFAGRIPGRAK